VSDAESRWGHLVGAAFRLDEAAPADPHAVLRALESVLEVFDAQLDPVDDYPGYAVRRLAMSLHKALAR
jgi:hypothetical protein